MQKKIVLQEKLVVHVERGICVPTVLNMFCFVDYCYEIISLQKRGLPFLELANFWTSKNS